MNSLIRAQQQSTIEAGDLSLFTLRQLRQILTYKAGLSTADEVVISFVNTRGPIGPSEIVFIDNYCRQKKMTVTPTVGNLDESAWQQGGYITYSKEKIVINTQEPAEIPNQPIPTFGMKQREGQQNLAVILATVCQIETGQVTDVVAHTEWSNRFGFTDSPVIPGGVVAVKNCVAEVIEKSTGWHTVVSTKKTLKGCAFFQFLSEVLSSCDIIDYYALHGSVCCNLLNVFTMTLKGKKLIPHGRKTVKGSKLQPLAPISSIKICKDVPKAQEFCDRMGYFPVLLVGPMPTRISFPPSNNPTIEIAMEAHAKGLSFKGGNSVGLAKLTCGLGFSGMPSNQCRRLIPVVSICLGLLNENQKVDVQLTLGDIVPFINSMQAWYHPEDGMDMYWDQNLRILVDDRSYLKVSPKHLEYVVHKSRPGAHFVWHADENVPSILKVKNTQAQLDEWQRKLLSILPTSYTVIVPVMSPFVFLNHSVYRGYWDPDFNAIVSTRRDLVKFDNDENSLFPKIETFDEHLSNVISVNRHICTYFLSPTSFYTPWSNNLAGPPAGAVMALSEEMLWDIFVPEVDPNSVLGGDLGVEHEIALDAVEPEEDDEEEEGLDINGNPIPRAEETPAESEEEEVPLVRPKPEVKQRRVVPFDQSAKPIDQGVKPLVSVNTTTTTSTTTVTIPVVPPPQKSARTSVDIVDTRSLPKGHIAVATPPVVPNATDTIQEGGGEQFS